MEVRFDLLSDEELVEFIREEEELALDELIKRYNKMIYSIAGKFFRGEDIGWASKEDAIKEGKSALYIAVCKYNKEKGKFKNYAEVTIEKYIQNYINSNRSLIISLATRKKINKVFKVASELQSFSDDDNNDLVYLLNNKKELIKMTLYEKYQEEVSDEFLVECLHYLNIHEISLNQIKEDKNGKEVALHEEIPSKNPSPVKDIEDQEALVIFRGIYKKGMQEIINNYSQGKRSDIQKDILERYYIHGEEELSLIASLNNSGYKGDTFLRQIKSRFKKEICKDHMSLIHSIINKLKDFFDFSDIGSKESFCDDFIDLCEAVRNLGLLKEDEL